MAVRSKRLVGPALVSTTDPTLIYTVPANRTALIKGCTFTDPVAANPVTICYLMTGTGANSRFFSIDVGGGWVAWNGGLPFVFGPGVTIYAHSPTLKASLRVTLFGAELDGVAP